MRRESFMAGGTVVYELTRPKSTRGVVDSAGMADADRDRWEARYREHGPILAGPSALLPCMFF